MTTLSTEDQRALDVLRSAVADALERKRRLGQYAVIWRDGQIVRIGSEEKAVTDPSEPSMEQEPQTGPARLM
ncbi:MAG TPA: hypothetical protein PK826_07550 [Anaerolineae bacterium]|nr:hypothetical protein [Anaerolineae bacterium]